MAEVVPSQDMDGPHGDPEEVRLLLERLSAILRRVEGVAISSYEELDGGALLPLIDETRGALVAAVEAVGDVLHYYDAIADQRASQLNILTEGPRSGELCGEVERVMDEDFGMTRIQNVAFIARMGLRARLLALDAMGASPGKWEIIGAASSALREVMKALGALAVVVCDHESLPEPTTFYVTELERSLIIRRAYRIFYGDVAPSREPQGSEIQARLRRAANAIAKLVGRPIYPSLRVHDRFALRTTQRKLQGWLSDASLDAKARETAGIRLFQNLAHLAELMLAVNERAELRQHDARVITEQIAALESDRADVGAALRALRVVEGRDLRLDAMLAGDEPPTRSALLARLRELGRNLAPRPPSTPAPRPFPGDLTESDDFL